MRERQPRGRLLRVLTEVWLPRLLFWLACAVAAGLVGLVLLAPLLARAAVTPGTAARWLDLFAADATVRRTAVASALGLLVTACVFFRAAPAASRQPARKQSRPPAGGVGA